MVPNECHSIGANASTDSRFFDNSSSAASRVSELNEESYLPKGIENLPLFRYFWIIIDLWDYKNWWTFFLQNLWKFSCFPDSIRKKTRNLYKIRLYELTPCAKVMEIGIFLKFSTKKTFAKKVTPQKQSHLYPIFICCINEIQNTIPITE